MTKEITQEERLDLKNLKEEWNAYYNNLLDGLKTVENKKVFIEKDVRDSILMANCDLMAENERLKKQLDREIKINRKMKSALEKYANFQASGFASVNEESLLEMIKFAQQVLKEIDNKE